MNENLRSTMMNGILLAGVLGVLAAIVVPEFTRASNPPAGEPAAQLQSEHHELPPKPTTQQSIPAPTWKYEIHSGPEWTAPNDPNNSY